MKTLFFSLVTFLASSIYLQAEQIDVSQHPTIGSPQAPVQVVAFLEPKCPDSKRYSNTSFPKLQKEFIDTNKVRYSVITTSFLPQSMPASIALLCVYNQDNHPRTDLFFKYLDYIYKNQPPERQNWATIETLERFAANTSPSINQEQLRNCIVSGHFRGQIRKNTAFGDQLMGHISTPTIFVDGVRVENKDDTIDYDKLKTAIQQALENKQSD